MKRLLTLIAVSARSVCLCEIVPDAINDAVKNARENKIRNAEFIVGDAVKIIPRLYRDGIRADVVIVDPPRAGCEKKVLETFAAMNPAKIVYVSCNPATLARDIAILNELGYRAEKIQPVDMFPFSGYALDEMKKFLPAILANLSAALSEILLMASAAWLIASAALQPPLSALSVGITLVRTAGISRAALRYADRFFTHKIIFKTLDELREKIFLDAVSKLPLKSGLTGEGELLHRLTVIA